MNKDGARLQMLAAVVIFGTIGLFVRNIPLSSATIACARGIMGSTVIILFLIMRRQKPDWEAIKRNMGKLCISGAMIGINWILLFEAYRYTTIAIATLCYYLAPAFMILATPIAFQEKLTVKKIICVTVALIGMVFVSGVMGGTVLGEQSHIGMLMGVSAAVLYAAVVIVNKKLDHIPAYEQTVVQLSCAALVLIPYIAVTMEQQTVQMTGTAWICLLFVGIVNTGLAYVLYFGSMQALPTQTVALMGYIDPIVAILLSAWLLHETMTWGSWIGAILILGAMVFSEIKK